MSTTPSSVLTRVPAVVWVTAVSLGFFGVLSSNSALTPVLGLLLVWIFLMLYRPGDSSILLLAACFQWLQVGVKVLHANLLGEHVNSMAQYGGDVERATWFSAGALFALVCGMRLAIGRYDQAHSTIVKATSSQIATGRVLFLYAMASVGGNVLLSVAPTAGGFYQAVLALANLKWAAYFAVAYICFIRPRHLGYLAVVFCFEFVLSLGGYFAGFKVVFFVTALAYMTADAKLKRVQYATLGALATTLLLATLVWTAVKASYRDFLSGGVSAQIVVVGYPERVEELVRQVSNLTIADYANATTKMAERIAYVDFFGSALDWVPSNAPHTGGEQWSGALLHILTPRFLWSDKSPLPNDSDVTMEFTGLHLPSYEEGTSISLGYVAQSYIDFGPFWMFAPIFLLGIVWGGIYRYFVNLKSELPLLSQALVIPVLLMTLQFEAAIAKLVGGVITSFLVAWLVQRFASPHIERFLGVSRLHERDVAIPSPRHERIR